MKTITTKLFLLVVPTCIGLVSAGLPTSLLAAEQTDSAFAQAKEAARRLADYHGDNRDGERRVVHLVYWTPADREPVAEYQRRLSAIMLDIQDFYADEMERHGLGRRTFNLKQADGDLLEVLLVKGEEETSQYKVASGHKIRDECWPVLRKNHIDLRNETVMIFCNLANWDEKTKVFTHKSPYYAMGGSRGGIGWQLDSPTLAVDRLKLKQPIISDGQYGRISLGKHNSIFIGGIAHELGHALGVPHCRETRDEHHQIGTALMGAGNRTYGDERRGEGKGSFLTFAHALRLASHPQFSGSTQGLTEHAKIEIADAEVKLDGNRLTITGQAKSMIPIYGVVAYFDSDGGGDYDALTATAMPDEDGRFTVESPQLPKNQRGELRVFPLVANGETTDLSFRPPLQRRYHISD